MLMAVAAHFFADEKVMFIDIHGHTKAYLCSGY